ncbi:zeta toxin family protein [Legionella cardiaca]|uniref:Zeta toxin family protein n=1 Tax=Legionella cardiaca TaxID=1071983 RepID=A0ABY8ARM9_9GAMM|nr:zeta toxin family protein [Legionella cardiaca]WED42866.1 zeta toxin family protein [Legionella cardiaca]
MKQILMLLIVLQLACVGMANSQTLTCPPVDKQGKLRIDSQAEAILEKCIKQAPLTKTAFFNNKTQQYTAARQQLHNQIITEILKNKPCQVKQPIVIFTAGLPGAGKSTYLQKKLPWVNSKTFAAIDADEIRAKLPEYKGWNVESTMPEVKDIVDDILNRIGKPCEYNLVYDSPMIHADFYEQLIAKLKAMHYQTYIVYVKTPLNVAIARAKNRYLETGRYVSKSYLAEAEKNGQQTFNTIKKKVDGYIIVDGENFQTIEQGGKPFPKHVSNK